MMKRAQRGLVSEVFRNRAITAASFWLIVTVLVIACPAPWRVAQSTDDRAEVRDQGSGVGGRKTEDRRQKTEDSMAGATQYPSAAENRPWRTHDAIRTTTNEPSEQWQTRRMRVTAYCPCEKCCGQDAEGITACGHRIRLGDTFVAADRRYSFGTQMIIAGYGDDQPVKVLDRGGAIKGDRLDVFFHTHQRALEWGVRYIDVKIRVK